AKAEMISDSVEDRLAALEKQDEIEKLLNEIKSRRVGERGVEGLPFRVAGRWVSRGRVRRLVLRRALRAGDAQIPQEARNLVGRPTEDRRRGESLRLPGGGVRVQLRLGTGANLDAAARDEPGDPDGPQRLWSIRRLAGLWRE